MWTKCPHCGEWHEVTELRDSPPLEVIIKSRNLSPVAAAILQNRDHLPPQFLRGEPVSLRILGGMLGYSHPHVRKGLIELSEFNLIQTVEFGRAGRKQYAASSRLSRAKVTAA